MKTNNTSNNKTLPKRIFDIIQIGQKEDLISRLFDIFIVIVILLNIATLFLKTFDQLARYGTLFYVIEMVTMIIFVMEYLLRIWTAPCLYPNSKKAKAVWKFMISYDGIIELFTILPYFVFSGFVVFRMLRVVRIFHLFRINSYSDSFSVIKNVLYEKRNQLLSSIFIIIVLMLASSLFMYSAEHEAQPDAFQNAFSGLWWSMSTLLTVGYGDIYPITVVGRIMAIVIAFLGVGVVAIPTGIISAGFVEQYRMEAHEDDEQLCNIHTIVVSMDSNWIGKTVQEIEDLNSITILLIDRDGQKKRAENDTVIALKDALTIYK